MSAPSKTKRIGKTGTQQERSGVVRRLVLFGGSLGAAVAMWFHPHAGHDVYASLSPVADTFVVTHVLLFASLATIAMGLYFLSSGYRGLPAALARTGAGVFGFFYLGYVATVGVAKGLLIREGQTLPAEQQAGVAEVVQYIHTEPLLFAAGAVGAVGYLVAVGALAVVLYRADAPRVPLALLVASSVAIGAHHGPLAVAGMGSFVVAIGWLEFGWSERRTEPD
ncbi:hypothetical protein CHINAEXTREME_06000 [Halobiforma lacisalsi AJ5]|uniref:Uncharacterized protein n=1 Tax=Natronobacterium lacisalsi AJ5 TaxID=358396 RepID=M0LWE7_NATLA|nr:hypothetical protein [Halobiforma lacisalsi]APW97347.1 hypothetical protein CHINAEXTREME_06000 [Halobiforma lacisalsi AJ5]EMA37902.1 hypothetical protein C445_00605 [Halobiforma lacisalsi AJ5]